MITLIKNSQVVFIDAEGKEHKGVIIDVLTQSETGGTARIDYTKRKKDSDGKDVAANEKEHLGHHTAVADYSEERKPLTFHFVTTPAAKAPAASNGAPASTK